MDYWKLLKMVVLLRHAYQGHDTSVIPDDQLDLLKDKLVQMDRKFQDEEDYQSFWRYHEGWCAKQDDCEWFKEAKKLYEPKP